MGIWRCEQAAGGAIPRTTPKMQIFGLWNLTSALGCGRLLCIPRDGLTPLRLKSFSVIYALVPGRSAAEDVFSAMAARMSAFNAFSSMLSPSDEFPRDV